SSPDIFPREENYLIMHRITSKNDFVNLLYRIEDANSRYRKKEGASIGDNAEPVSIQQYLTSEQQAWLETEKIIDWLDQEHNIDLHNALAEVKFFKRKKDVKTEVSAQKAEIILLHAPSA